MQAVHDLWRDNRQPNGWTPCAGCPLRKDDGLEAELVTEAIVAAIRHYFAEDEVVQSFAAAFRENIIATMGPSATNEPTWRDDSVRDAYRYASRETLKGLARGVRLTNAIAPVVLRLCAVCPVRDGTIERPQAPAHFNSMEAQCWDDGYTAALEALRGRADTAEGVMREALDSIAKCALGGCKGCRNLAVEALRVGGAQGDKLEIEKDSGRKFHWDDS